MSAPTIITEPGLYTDMPDHEYHADPVPGGSLSSTFARLLTQHVPAKALERRRNHKPTKAMNLGTAAHLEALGAGPQLVVWQHDGRTKDGKAERAEWAPLIASQAAVGVTENERAQVLGMAEALRAHDEVRAILDRAESEMSAFWREGDVWCRSRFDLLDEDAAYDYKTTQDASSRGFSKAMGAYGFHQQADFYERSLSALHHPAADRQLRFICQETEPPFLVQIHWADEEARDVAKQLNDRAIGIYEACTKSGEWPAYESIYGGPAPLPAWFFFDHEEQLDTPIRAELKL